MRQAPDALGYFVGDYEGLDWAGGGLKPGFKPFFVRLERRHADQPHRRVRDDRVDEPVTTAVTPLSV